MTNESAVQEVVAAEPKLFVGQVPIDCSEQALIDLMKQHATAQEPVSVTMPKRGNVPQSCKFAMVTFDKWQSAEAAIEALHGSTALGSKPLVVRFADPPKGEDSKGIVPKKLFVGQPTSPSCSSLNGKRQKKRWQRSMAPNRWNPQ